MSFFSAPEIEHTGLQLILSPDGRDNSLTAHQDMTLHQLRLDAQQTTDYTPAAGRTLYLHMVAGEVEVHDTVLKAGDGATIKLDKEQDSLQFQALASAEALLFDLV